MNEKTGEESNSNENRSSSQYTSCIPCGRVFLKNFFLIIVQHAYPVPGFSEWLRLIQSLDETPPFIQVNILEVIANTALDNVIQLVAHTGIVLHIIHLEMLRHKLDRANVASIHNSGEQSDIRTLKYENMKNILTEDKKCLPKNGLSTSATRAPTASFV